MTSQVRPIEGPLYFERTGRSGPVLAFLPPNPMDQSCWMYQMAHLSTWFRCIAIDTPGYGRSPKADARVTAEEIAEAFWEAVDEVDREGQAVLVGCSGGFLFALHMYRMRPNRTSALILVGASYIEAAPTQVRLRSRIDSFRKYGLDFRRRMTFQDLSAAFRATPMASYLADIFTERNELADLDSIIHQFEALAAHDMDSLLQVDRPVLILSGTEDVNHERAFLLQDRIVGSELQILPGAGHACMLEQPWLFDRLVIDFLTRHGLCGS